MQPAPLYQGSAWSTGARAWHLLSQVLAWWLPRGCVRATLCRPRSTRKRRRSCGRPRSNWWRPSRSWLRATGSLKRWAQSTPRRCCTHRVTDGLAASRLRVGRGTHACTQTHPATPRTHPLTHSHSPTHPPTHPLNPGQQLSFQLPRPDAAAWGAGHAAVQVMTAQRTRPDVCTLCRRYARMERHLPRSCFAARREYAAAATAWRKEKSTNEAALQHAYAERQAQEAANAEISQGISAIEAAAAGDDSAFAALKLKYADTVRRMAVSQARFAGLPELWRLGFCAAVSLPQDLEDNHWARKRHRRRPLTPTLALRAAEARQGVSRAGGRAFRREGSS